MSHEEDVRIAASLSLGKMALGNTSHYIPEIIQLIKKSDAKSKFLYLNTIKEVIVNQPQALEPEVTTLTSELIELADSSEERVQSVVAECIGRLFQLYGAEMGEETQDVLKANKKPKQTATIARSFMYSGMKMEGQLNLVQYQENAECLCKLIGSKDVNVKKFSVEGLLAMVKTNWRVVKDIIPQIEKMAFDELTQRKEFVEEIALPDGTTQSKDNGVPLRLASYNLVYKMYEVGAVGNEVVIKLIEQIAKTGLAETIDDVLLLSYNILAQLTKRCSFNVVPKVDSFLAAVIKKFDF